MVFLAALAGITCLTRAAVGDIVAAGGADLAAALLEECRSVAVAAGHSPRPESLQAALGRLTDAGSTVTASMVGDVERRGPNRRRCAGDPEGGPHGVTWRRLRC